MALAVLSWTGLVHTTAAHAASTKPRVVLMHDPELDDQNTLIRYLLYTNELDTEALIYTSSGVHWAGDGQGTKALVPGSEPDRTFPGLCPCESWRWREGEQFIHDTLDAYEQVQANLKTHDPAFPTADELRAKTFWGNIEFHGDISKESAGSNKIKELLLDDKPGPLYLLTGGGQSTIARALKSIKDQYQGTPEWEAIYTKVARKAIIQSWGDQDQTNANYIGPNWPDIEWREMRTSIWGYGARNAILPQDRFILDAAWQKPNVSDRGPLGAMYRVWGDGVFMDGDPGSKMDFFGFRGRTAEELRAEGYVVWTPIQEPGSWISEGDTSIMMNLLDNGLRGYEHRLYGGWGGRGAQDVNPATGTPNNNYASVRWFNAAQQDFAARLRWSVIPAYEDANHEPVVTVDGPLNIAAAQGDTVNLSAVASDPDGDQLTYRWWQYTDADTYPGAVTLSSTDTLSTSFQVPTPNSVIPPSATPGQTIHLILEVTDNGTPALKSYQRVIVTVAARASTRVGATVPSTLSLSLGGAPAFGAFVPGTAATYTATSTATVTSTASDALLTIGDPSPLATGRMVNGTNALTSPLQVKAASAAGAGSDFAALSGLANPLTLLSYSGPVMKDAVSLSWQQAIGATEVLRSGSYSKVVSLTLSTTNP